MAQYRYECAAGLDHHPRLQMEGGRLRDTVLALQNAFDQRGVGAEILVVDDGSTDDTAAIAGAAINGTRCIRHRSNLGKGAAIKTGFHHAQGEWVVMSDADLSVPAANKSPRDFLSLALQTCFVDRLRSHADSKIIAQPAYRQFIWQTLQCHFAFINQTPLSRYAMRL
ncbi:MAG: glycosyltransferase family 2 protein [Patescibacteria group bacterium]